VGFSDGGLETKELPSEMDRVDQTSCGRGEVGVNINGKHGNYFSTNKGLRQGDPLSPLLFNLIGDALAAMLDKARNVGHIRGLVQNLLEGGITHLHYRNTSCESITRVGLDHSPIIVNTSDTRFQHQKVFRFEMQCLEQRGFRERVMEKWPKRREGENIQDFWRDIKVATRRFGRGWRMNFHTIKNGQVYPVGKDQ
jgi:hypothetical protein